MWLLAVWVRAAMIFAIWSAVIENSNIGKRFFTGIQLF